MTVLEDYVSMSHVYYALEPVAKVHVWPHEVVTPVIFRGDDYELLAQLDISPMEINAQHLLAGFHLFPSNELELVSFHCAREVFEVPGVWDLLLSVPVEPRKGLLKWMGTHVAACSMAQRAMIDSARTATIMGAS